MDGTIPSTGGEEHSLTGLILDADPVVQAVIVGLVLASIICWAVIFEKIIQLGRLNRDVRKLEGSAKGDQIEGDARLVQLRFVQSRCDGHLKSRPREQEVLRLLVNRVCDENPMHRGHQSFSFEGLAVREVG
jgi:hypothetical protein